MAAIHPQHDTTVTSYCCKNEWTTNAYPTELREIPLQKETNEGRRLLFSLIRNGLRKPLMNKPYDLIDKLFPELRTN